jgi:sigma-B regulation protein RsbU (phosphoserine phosphatase)
MALSRELPSCSTCITNAGPARVLIADDQPHVLEALRLLLKGDGHEVELVSTPAAVLEALGSARFDCALIDLNYTRDTTSGEEGMNLLAAIKQRDESLPVIVMTAWATLETAIAALRRGASDFVQKPWDNSEVLNTVRTQVLRRCMMLRGRAAQEDEIEEARGVQQNLLPRVLPEVAGYDIAAWYRPARALAGDYYDVIRRSDGRVLICIADVAGKGVAAALLMANLQALVHKLSAEHMGPAALAAVVNQYTFANTSAERFITFFCALLDPATGKLEYCNAGHEPPFVIGPGNIRCLHQGGTVLGCFADWRGEEGSASMDPGDALVCYTDGLLEVERAGGKELERSQCALRAASVLPRSAPQILNALVHDFPIAPAPDDATVAVIVRVGAGNSGPGAR